MAQPTRRATAKATATASASPFSAKGTILSIPASVVPGAPFGCDLVVTNETDERLTGAFVELQHSANARLMEGTIAVNGRTIARSLVRSTEGRLSVKLPTMAPRSEVRVTWDSLVDVPADNGAKGSLSVSVSATGASFGTSAEFTVTSSVDFSNENCYFKVQGDEAIAVGEKRTLSFYIVNDGTMSARDAAIELACDDFALLGVDFVDELLPGDARTVSATVELVSDSEQPSLAPILNFAGGSYEFAPFAFVRTEGPKFENGSSFLDRRSSEPLAPSGGRIVVAVTLENVGERPGQPTVSLVLPDHARALFSGEATADATLSFRRIEPGETETQELIVEVGPCEALEIGAVINASEGEIALSPLVVPVERQTSLVPMNFAVIDDAENLRVDEPFAVHLEFFSESNAAIDKALFALNYGPSLAYVPGSLAVNGNKFGDAAFAVSNRLAFKNIDYGAVIALDLDVVASRPTLRGAVTAIGATIAWDGKQQSAELGGLSIAPRALTKPLEELPFVVCDAEDTDAIGSSRIDRAVSERDDTAAGARSAPAQTSAPAEAAAGDAAKTDGASTQGDAEIEDEVAKLGTANLGTTSGAPAQAPAAAPPVTGGTGTYATGFAAVPFDPRDVTRLRGNWATLVHDHPNAFGQVAALESLIPTKLDDQNLNFYFNGRDKLGKAVRSVLMRAENEDQPQARRADLEAFCEEAAPLVRMMPPDFLNRFPSWESEKMSFAVCFAAYASFAGLGFDDEQLRSEAHALAHRLIDVMAEHDDVTYAEWPALLADDADPEGAEIVNALAELVRNLAVAA